MKKRKKHRVPFSSLKLGAKFENQDDILEITQIGMGVHFTLTSKHHNFPIHVGDYPKIGILASILEQDKYTLIN